MLVIMAVTSLIRIVGVWVKFRPDVGKAEGRFGPARRVLRLLGGLRAFIIAAFVKGNNPVPIQIRLVWGAGASGGQVSASQEQRLAQVRHR
jgi:hypothetical protein